MHLTLLLVSLASTPAAVPQRIADDATIGRALQRSQQLGEELLATLPELVRNSPRARIQAILDEVRHDQTRVTREGRNAAFEAAVLVNYDKLCQWAEEYLGENRVHFQPVRDATKIEFPVAFVGGIRQRAARVAFAETLFSLDELEDINKRAGEMILALGKHEKLDPYQNSKWKRELTVLRDQVRQAEDALRLPSQLNKVIPEAKLLGAYAQIVGLSIQQNR